MCHNLRCFCVCGIFLRLTHVPCPPFLVPSSLTLKVRVLSSVLLPWSHPSWLFSPVSCLFPSSSLVCLVSCWTVFSLFVRRFCCTLLQIKDHLLETSASWSSARGSSPWYLTVCYLLSVSSWYHQADVFVVTTVTTSRTETETCQPCARTPNSFLPYEVFAWIKWIKC